MIFKNVYLIVFISCFHIPNCLWDKVHCTSPAPRITLQLPVLSLWNTLGPQLFFLWFHTQCFHTFCTPRAFAQAVP
jgi:hypothetical protein